MLVIGVVAGCSVLAPQGTSVVLKKECFHDIQQYAKLASAAYQDTAKIRKVSTELGYRLIKHDLVPGVDVQYFLLVNPRTNAQVISVRGTANLENVLVDVKVAMQMNQRLGIRLHRGFSSAANAVYKAVKPLLDKQAPVSLVGHSLGGAVAAILAMNLNVDGYSIGQVTTFGQPKFTDRLGVEKYKEIPITRVVNEKDMVPLVPHIEAKLSLFPSIYWHLGDEIVLFPGRYYSHLNAKESMARGLTVLKTSVIERDVDAHRMVEYMASIKEKMHMAKVVSYRERAGLMMAGNTP
jgi:hypothetical protein